jgi:uncharacterized protein YchJ
VWAQATADEVVRARYTAYAKRVVDFIVASTHPLHESFQQDIQHWKKTIEADCYDNFELTGCEILDTSTTGDEGSPDEKAVVKFTAHMTQRDTQQRIAFVETSTFERDPKTGAWLYRIGVVETVPKDEKEA